VRWERSRGEWGKKRKKRKRKVVLRDFRIRGAEERLATRFPSQTATVADRHLTARDRTVLLLSQRLLTSSAVRGKSMATPEVDKFGQLLVTKLRDAALDFFGGLARGHWKSPSTRQLQADIAELSSEQRELVRRCVLACVDRGIHDFLFALSESHDCNGGISLVLDGRDIASLSDGLHGEPYGEDGWVAKFGKHPEGRE
jgi:hypothetical protein